jgi:hypothetical protein
MRVHLRGVYDRYSYENEKAEALAKLSDLIERIVSPDRRDSNPIPLRVRRADRQPDLQSTG